MRKLTGVILAAAFALAVPAAFAQEVSVAKLAVGTGLKKEVLQGEATAFASSVRGVYCQATLDVKAGAKFTLVWKHNSVETGQTQLQAPKATKAYVFTGYKRVRPGAWTVELLDGAGLVLSTLAFTVS